MANTLDHAYANFDEELAAFGRDVVAMVNGELTTLHAVSSYREFDLGFISSMPKYETRVVGGIESLMVELESIGPDFDGR